MDDLTLEERERAQQLNRKIYSMTEIEELVYIPHIHFRLST